MTAEKPNVYFIDSSTFLIYSYKDVTILKALRMVTTDVCAGDTDASFSVSSIMPEQVAVLKDYGLVNIFSSNEESNSSKGFCEIPDEPEKEKELWSKAESIVKGRKAKESKRKIVGDGKTAHAYKVTEKEKHMFEASEEEIQRVYEELLEKMRKNPKKLSESIELLAVSEESVKSTTDQPDHVLFPDCVRFLERKKVLHDLWLKGFYLTSGLKFGCHFLVYSRNPDEVHSTYMVHCRGQKSLSDFDALRRVSSQTKKSLVIARAAPDAPFPEYTMLTRFTGLEECDDRPLKGIHDKFSI